MLSFAESHQLGCREMMFLGSVPPRHGLSHPGKGSSGLLRLDQDLTLTLFLEHSERLLDSQGLFCAGTPPIPPGEGSSSFMTLVLTDVCQHSFLLLVPWHWVITATPLARLWLPPLACVVPLTLPFKESFPETLFMSTIRVAFWFLLGPCPEIVFLRGK